MATDRKAKPRNRFSPILLVGQTAFDSIITAGLKTRSLRLVQFKLTMTRTVLHFSAGSGYYRLKIAYNADANTPDA
jgi:hypothetical protein